MGAFDLANPVFRLYVVAAAIMTLKLMGQGWATVAVMMRRGRGYASPEDLRPGAINRAPDPAQLDPDPAVERARRMHRNDPENIPGFLVAGLLFVAVAPLRAAWLLMDGFALTRAGHARPTERRARTRRGRRSGLSARSPWRRWRSGR